MAAATPHDLRVLFVTRSYPPAVGGMEKLSAEFTAALSAKTPSLVIANRHGKAALPFFLPTAALQLRRLAHQFDIIHLGDPLLTCLLPFLPHRAGDGADGGGWGSSGRRSPERAWFPDTVGESEGDRRSEHSTLGSASDRLEPRRPQRPRRGLPPVAVTIHGLDILYPNPLYQALLRRFLPRVNLALCISRFVETEMRRRFPSVQTMVITPGIGTSLAVPATTGLPRVSQGREWTGTRRDLERALNVSFGDGPLLLTVARLVRRKGVAWFVEHVLPGVPAAHFLVLGDGPERPRILAAARRAGVAARITLAGTVPMSVLQLAYATADLFVIPNIPNPGDAEGFGLVALEAASVGLPVLAANLEGIRDAVVEGETGRLIPPEQPERWRTVVTRLLADAEERARFRERAPTVVRERFSWEHVANQTLAAFSRVVAENTVPRAPV